LKDAVGLHHDGIDHIVPDDLKLGVAQQVRDVLLAAGEEVVQTEHFFAPGEQDFAQMRTDKTGTAGDQINVRHAGTPSPRIAKAMATFGSCAPK
jgi:hypothetical protein